MSASTADAETSFERTAAAAGGASDGASIGGDAQARRLRLLALLMVAAMIAFLINNYLIVWLGFDSVLALFGALSADGVGGPSAFLTSAVYAAALALGALAVYAAPDRSLRAEADRLHRLNLFIVRAAFWSFTIIGLVDAILSFLRVEGLLEASSIWASELVNPIFSALGAPLYDAADPEALRAFGSDLASDLGRSQFRGPYVHMPLLLVGVLLAAITRTLGFQWFALLVVIAELAIVIGRFVFSYEQTFMSDLVRLWYAGLFLFASAYTLYEDGHVRVDVVYAGFSDVTKGWVNAFGSLALGVPLCWLVLMLGMWDNFSIINGSLLNYETSQSGFGMYIKYWMAAFLGVFAVTMLIQFMSYFLESAADIRREPGKRAPSGDAAH